MELQRDRFDIPEMLMSGVADGQIKAQVNSLAFVESSVTKVSGELMRFTSLQKGLPIISRILQESLSF